MLKKLKQFRQKKWVSFVTNIYVLILSAFLVWMFFFDTNSFFIHQELNDDIKKLENNKKVYQEEIKNDKVFIEKMKDSNEIEKFAREKYYLKKDDEDIFIIEHEDSIKNKNNK